MFYRHPKPFWFYGLVLSVIVVLTGCGNRSQSDLQNQVNYLDQTDLFSSPIRDNSLLVDPKAAIATVEGKPISRGEFERELRLRAMKLKQSVTPEQFEELAPNIQELALQDLIIRELLKKAIEKDNVEISSEEVEKGLTQIRSSLPKDTPWEKFLTTSKLTEESLRDHVRTRLRVDKLLFTRVRDIPEPSEDEIRFFYNQNREQFQQPDGAENGRESARTLAFDEVHDWIKVRLNEQTRQQAVRTYVQELIDAADVVILGAPQRQDPDHLNNSSRE